MNVGFNFLWWLDLDNQVNIRDVEATGRDICCDQNFEFSFLESLHSDLTLILNDVTVHDFDILLDLISQNQSIGIGLGLSKHDSFTRATVAYQDISEGR
jgi:hypothetical protein